MLPRSTERLLYLNSADDRGHDAEFGLNGYALYQHALKLKERPCNFTY